MNSQTQKLLDSDSTDSTTTVARFEIEIPESHRCILLNAETRINFPSFRVQPPRLFHF